MVHRGVIHVAAFALSVISLAPVTRAQDAGACEYKAPQGGLTTRDGFVEFIAPATLDPLKAALPKLEREDLDQVMRAGDTMWFDEESMVFLYQDSVEVVVGGRANCVGRKVGERNQGSVIGKLMNYFGPDYRFKFPFRKAAGTDDVTNVKVLNFWAPPKKNGKALPVKWWQESSRGRWHWVFPVGTVFGEVLYEQAPNGQWIVFEVRTRKRYLDGWEPNLFRPYPTADSLAAAITQRRPQWARTPDLQRLVAQLRNKDSLVATRLVSEAYGKVFPPVDGALDTLPDVTDKDLIVELLTQAPFKSVEGAIWKENGKGLETYGPASAGDFNVVPKGYKMGMIQTNEVSCNRCHVETGHPLGDFEFDIILYGEVWGEDRIFTWHLFEPNQYVFDTWDDRDVPSRKVNGRMAQANLLKQERVASGDPLYKVLPIPYTPGNR